MPRKMPSWRTVRHQSGHGRLRLNARKLFYACGGTHCVPFPALPRLEVVGQTALVALSLAFQLLPFSCLFSKKELSHDPSSRKGTEAHR